MKNKLVVLILTMALVASTYATNISAAEEIAESTEQKTITDINTTDAVYEGEFGKMHWKVDPVTKTLTITGTGAYEYDESWWKTYDKKYKGLYDKVRKSDDYYLYNGPWRLSKTKIENIVFSEGITSIELGYDQFTYLDFGNKEYGQNGVKKLLLPNSAIKVTATASMKNDVYDGPIFETLIVGKNLKRGLKELCFANTKNVEIAEGNIAYIKDKDTIYPKNKKILIKYLGNKKTVKVNSKVTTIGKGAFYDKDSKLEKITLPKSLKKIDVYAFAGKKLKKITIPKKTKKIEAYAFEGAELKTIVMSNSTKVDVYRFTNVKATIKYRESFKKIKPTLVFTDMRWNKISGAKGYCVEIKYIKGEGPNTKKTVKKNSAKSLYSDAVRGYRVRGYKKVKGKKVYTKWSKWVGGLIVYY